MVERSGSCNRWRRVGVVWVALVRIEAQTGYQEEGLASTGKAETGARRRMAKVGQSATGWEGDCGNRRSQSG